MGDAVAAKNDLAARCQRRVLAGQAMLPQRRIALLSALRGTKVLGHFGDTLRTTVVLREIVKLHPK